MRPEALLMTYGTTPAPPAGVDAGANATKQGSLTTAVNALTILNVGASGDNNAIILAINIANSPAGSRAVSTVTGYADSWQRISTQNYSFTLAGNLYNFVQEVWLGLKATAGSPTNVVVTFTGTLTESAAYILKTFNNINQSTPKDANANALKTAQNATLSNVDTTLTQSSNAAGGIRYSVVQNPAEWFINAPSGYSILTQNAAHVITNSMGLAWAPYSSGALSNVTVSYGSKDLWMHDAGILANAA